MTCFCVVTQPLTHVSVREKRLAADILQRVTERCFHDDQDYALPMPLARDANTILPQLRLCFVLKITASDFVSLQPVKCSVT